MSTVIITCAIVLLSIVCLPILPVMIGATFTAYTLVGWLVAILAFIFAGVSLGLTLLITWIIVSLNVLVL